MATQVTEYLICDMHGEQEVEAEASHEFSVDGTSYKIDLCETHQGQFERALAKFIENADAQRGSGQRQRGNTPRTTGTDPSTIRDWAKTKGMNVAERGRIPAEIVDAYKQAHQKNSQKVHAA